MITESDASSVVESNPEDHTEGIYQHVKMPEWGYAILAWEKPTKRGYQFGDGTLRVFKKGFYNLMQEVDPADDFAADLEDELNRRLKETEQFSTLQEKQIRIEPVYPFATQLQIFENLYPGGFSGEMWLERVRGAGVKKRLKRHRDAAILEARELLAQEALTGLIAEGKGEEIVKRASAVLNGTDLVSKKRTDAIGELTGDKAMIFAIGLTGLLYGEGRYTRKRLEVWLNSLKQSMGTMGSWRMASALGGLVLVDSETCVRPAVFKKQAGLFAPNKVFTREPNRKSYKNYRRVITATMRQLKEDGYEPQDMMDVHDFIWATLRPAAAKHID